MTKRQKTIVSLAGPLDQRRVRGAAARASTALFYDPDQSVFWAGMAFLGFLQVTALVLNLLPVPGLDGYGALEPHLSPETQRALAPAKQWGCSSCCSCCSRRRSTSWFFAVVAWFFDLSGVPRCLVGARHASSPGSGRPGSDGRLATYASLRIDCSYGCRPRSRPCRRPCQPDGHRRGDPDRLLRPRADHRAGDQFDRPAFRRRPHAHRSRGDVHGPDRGAAGPARQHVAQADLRLAPGRGVHRGRERRAAARRRRCSSSTRPSTASAMRPRSPACR